VAEAGGSDVDDAVRAARLAFDTIWAPMRGAERAKYLYRIARIVQERARELAVLESIDNGKPIKESRDVDLPLANGGTTSVLKELERMKLRWEAPDVR
jgi:acyl-CoA reductase-like NAD-dependent aldehyde dehydrogenase